MNRFHSGLLFTIICLVSLALRIYQLGIVPPSPDWDEAALGYNAYSVATTGKDEYGTSYPLVLRSFDDYKPPLYMYLTIPSIAVFGLTVWAVRLPSVILGVLGVAGCYFLVRELVRLNEFKNRELNLYLPPASSLLLAISPWHIQFSRIAFEANTGLTLNIWMLYFCFAGLKRPKFFIPAAVISGLSLYAYHSERIFVPLMLLLLILLFFRQFYSHLKYVLISFVIGLFITMPLLAVLSDSANWTRLKGTSSLSDQTALLARSVSKLEHDGDTGNPWGIFLDNRRIVYAKTFLSGYLSHFSLKWLFFTGDNPRHHAPDMGLLYLWEMPFLFYGLYLLAGYKSRLTWFIFGWILISPVAAAPTTGLPHAIRTLVILPVPQIITAIGLIAFMLKIKTVYRKNFRFLIYILTGIILINIYYFLHMYFVHLNREYSEFWQYGYRQAVEYTEANNGSYRKIVVSTKLEQPYIFFLFYTRYDPVQYLKQGGTVSGGFEEGRNRFGKYEFRPINWNRELKDGSVLYVGTPGEIPADSGYVINYLNDKPAIVITR